MHPKQQQKKSQILEKSQENCRGTKQRA